MRRLPPEFDLSVYRARNDDLAEFDDQTLMSHFEEWGAFEGRITSTASTREGFLQTISPRKSTLEIGPFVRPLLAGKNVKYFDVKDRAGLEEMAVNEGHATDNSVDIDYISASGDLSVVDSRFSQIFSSHTIEHTPSLTEHLIKASNILRKSGRYFIIIPDKRYCFDAFIPESDISDVLEAHFENRKRHSLRSVIRTRAMVTHNEAWRHWAGDHGQRFDAKTDRNRILNAVHEHNSTSGYVDAHAWQFTPKSFREILTELRRMDLVNLDVERVYETARPRLEFYAVLRKS